MFPSFAKVRCCFLVLILVSLAVFTTIFVAPAIWKSFYQIETITKSFPSIGTPLELQQCKVTVNRVQRVPATSNPSSDFETLVVDLSIDSKVPINTMIFQFFDVWIEDKFGNKFTFSTADRRNQLLDESEVPASGALQVTAYFSVPKYSQELYLMLKPKIGGDPIKVKLY